MLKMLLSAFAGVIAGSVLVAAVIQQPGPDSASVPRPVELEPVSTGSDSRVASVEKRLDGIHEYLERLDIRLATLETTISDAKSAMSPVPSRDTGVEPATETTEFPLADTADDTTQREHIRSLSNHFITQDVDASWSLDAENRVLGLLSPDTEQSGISSASLSSLRCRATLCEGLIVAADTNSLLSFQDRMIDRLGTEFPSIRFGTLQQDAGGTSIVFYVTRPGFDVPAISPEG